MARQSRAVLSCIPIFHTEKMADDFRPLSPYSSQICSTHLFSCFNGGECVNQRFCDCSRFNATGPRCQAVYNSGLERDSICRTWGQYHFETFDGLYYYFPGKSTYALVRQHEMEEQSFSIQVHNDRDCRSFPYSCTRSISLFFAGEEEVRLSGNVTSKGVGIPLPHMLGKLQIQRVAEYVIVRHQFAFTLAWDGTSAVYIKMSPEYIGKTHGLCGNNNAIPQDDLLTSFGKLTEDVAEFVNSWQEDLPKEAPSQNVSFPFQSPCLGQSQESMQAIYELCETLLRSPFEMCHNYVSPHPFMAACTSDLCLSAADSSAWCRALTEYARACAHAARPLHSWRAQFPLSITCGNRDFTYNECVTCCPVTCRQQASCVESEIACVDGCYCADGLIYENEGCVQPTECPCDFHGSFYPTGSVVHDDCNNCTCVSGAWVCTDAVCPAECSVTGDSHFMTFDGRRYTFPATCHYILAKSHSSGEFTITLQNAPCGLNQDGACIQSVNLILNQDPRRQVTLTHSGDVLLSDQYKISLPYTDESFEIRKLSSIFLQVRTRIGVQVMYDCEGLRLYLRVDARWKEDTVGLCGTFNGNMQDDFLSPVGVPESTPQLFGNSWKTLSACTSEGPSPPMDPCDVHLQAAPYAAESCSILTGELFAPCSSYLSPVSYYEQCRRDTCKCGQVCLCSALAHYAHQCRRYGVSVDFRPHFPDCTVPCEDTQEYSSCSSSCGQTCQALSVPETCSGECVEGCACPAGTYLRSEAGRCVPRSECPCYFQGIQYPPGENIVTSLGQEFHEITLCLSASTCPPGQVFVNCSQPRATAGLSRERTCEDQLLNLTVPAHLPCLSGCACPQGLVRHGDECFVPEECPCSWKGKEYFPGDKVHSSCHTCTCQHGSFQCTFHPCASICTTYGDRHFRTFDGLPFDFVGTCKVHLVKGMSDISFSVIIENVNCFNTGIICRKFLSINVGKSFVIFDDDTGNPGPGSFLAEEQQVRVWKAGFFTLVHFPHEHVTLLWDQGTTVHIQAGPRWQGELSGLCGNFDLKTVNEMRTPENFDLTNAQEFGSSWAAGECVDGSDTRDPCGLNPLREPFAKKECGLLLGEVFEICHSVVDVTWFYSNCLTDTCGCNRGGDCECFCTSVSAYAHQCCQHGVSVDWRSPRVCPYDCEYFNRGLGKGPYQLISYSEGGVRMAARRSGGPVFPAQREHLVPGDTVSFRLTAGMYKSRTHDQSLVSIETADRPNYFLRLASNDSLALSRWEATEAFQNRSTFAVHRNTWVMGYSSFESFAKPGYFIHISGTTVSLKKYHHSEEFRLSTLFKLVDAEFPAPAPSACEWRYDSCTSPCFRTCRDPEGDDCREVPKVEGCVPTCLDHMVLDEITQRCVYLEDSATSRSVSPPVSASAAATRPPSVVPPSSAAVPPTRSLAASPSTPVTPPPSPADSLPPAPALTPSAPTTLPTIPAGSLPLSPAVSPSAPKTTSTSPAVSLPPPPLPSPSALTVPSPSAATPSPPPSAVSPSAAVSSSPPPAPSPSAPTSPSQPLGTPSSPPYGPSPSAAASSFASPAVPPSAAPSRPPFAATPTPAVLSAHVVSAAPAQPRAPTLTASTTGRADQTPEAVAAPTQAPTGTRARDADTPLPLHHTEAEEIMSLPPPEPHEEGRVPHPATLFPSKLVPALSTAPEAKASVSEFPKSPLLLPEQLPLTRAPVTETITSTASRPPGVTSSGPATPWPPAQMPLTHTGPFTGQSSPTQSEKVLAFSYPFLTSPRPVEAVGLPGPPAPTVPAPVHLIGQEAPLSSGSTSALRSDAPPLVRAPTPARSAEAEPTRASTAVPVPSKSVTERMAVPSKQAPPSTSPSGSPRDVGLGPPARPLPVEPASAEAGHPEVILDFITTPPPSSQPLPLAPQTMRVSVPGRTTPQSPESYPVPSEFWETPEMSSTPSAAYLTPGPAECVRHLCLEGQLIQVNRSQHCPFSAGPPSCGLRGPAVRARGDKCCPQWECACRCSFFPDLNVVTFDGNHVAVFKEAAYVVIQSRDEVVTVHVMHCESEALGHLSSRPLCLARMSVTHRDNEVIVDRLNRKVTVNSKFALSPVQKYGFKIKDTGNMYVIRTPLNSRIQWFHSSGLMVLEWNGTRESSTRGLCGFCDGEVGNDLMLPNGTVLEYADDPATFLDSWLVPTSLKSEGKARYRKANCSTTDCSACVQMVSNWTFRHCHAHVSPREFCELWVRDTELVQHPCMALTAYVAMCNKFDVCVEWRSPHYCPFPCPGDSAYQPCLAACATARTCRESDQEVQETDLCQGLSEGCVCPEGTLLHRPYAPLCVPEEKCACTDSSGAPRALGETWNASLSGCCVHRCVDNETVIPVEPPCPEPPRGCRRFGEVALMLPNDHSCCPRTICVCNQTLCDSLIPECKSSEKLIPSFREDSCCPNYECGESCDPEKCEPVGQAPRCRPDQTLIAGWLEHTCCISYICACGVCSDQIPRCQEGEVLVVDGNVTEERCCPPYHCVCESFRCPRISCGVGTALVEVWSPARCCPYQTCGKVTCPGLRPSIRVQGEKLQVDKKFRDGVENVCGCTTYKCVRERVCVSPGRGLLRPGQTVVERGADGTCRTSRCTHVPDPETDFYRIDTTSVDCHLKCTANQEYEPPRDVSTCCGTCRNVSCLHTFPNGTVSKSKPGTSWISNCVRYDCTSTEVGAVLVDSPVSCPPFNETDCLKTGGYVVPFLEGCCRTCKEDGKSCRKVTVRMTIRKNDCRSNTPVNIVSCDGKCPSASIYNYNINTYARFCKCCRELGLQRRSVQLYCTSNATWVTYTIQEPTDCSCQWS
uniref:Otogelin n=1 Tax=Ornithorhynchus anatinus TaxID=9258 RepID=F6U4F8_ORNAN